jgi:hypothetical protein
MEDPVIETGLSARGTPASQFFCRAHIDLSSRLTEECMHILIEEDADDKP